MTVIAAPGTHTQFSAAGIESDLDDLRDHLERMRVARDRAQDEAAAARRIATALEDENRQLRDAHRRIAGYEKATFDEIAAAGWSRQPAGEVHHAAAISAAVIKLVDQVRGGA